MVRQRLFNDIFMDDLNVNSINIRGGQTSTLPHVHNATSAANVTHVFAASITTSAVNTTATDGAGGSIKYEIRVFDKATGGTVNGATVKDKAYQYDGAKWNQVTKKVLVRANLILYQFDPEATDKLSIITVTASLADGALIFLDLVTMKAYQATTSGASAITIPTAAAISNAVNTGDYIGLRKTKTGVADVHLYRYKNTQVGFIEAPVEFKKFDRMVYITDVAGANDASASFSADAGANGMTKFNGAASTIKNNYGIIAGAAVASVGAGNFDAGAHTAITPFTAPGATAATTGAIDTAINTSCNSLKANTDTAITTLRTSVNTEMGEIQAKIDEILVALRLNGAIQQ